MEQIKIEHGQLKNLPMFFRIIHYNELSDINEENKLVLYNRALQSEQMSYSHSARQISKTVNYDIFKTSPNDK